MLGAIILGLMAALVWAVVRGLTLGSDSDRPKPPKQRAGGSPRDLGDDRADWLDAFRPDDW